MIVALACFDVVGIACLIAPHLRRRYSGGIPLATWAEAMKK